jgi:hypothetical protein
MNLRTLLLPVAISVSVLFSGCTPDELELTVYSSDVDTAERGEVVEIPATVRFSMVGKDEKGALQQATEIARRWLPSDTKFEVTKAQFGDKLVVETKIPMVAMAKARGLLEAQRPVLYIEVDHGRATLRGTTHLEILNRELRNINVMLGARLPARSTLVSLVGDRPPKSQSVEATAVFVNERPVLHLKEPIINRRTINILFSGKEGSVYKDFERIPPSFRLVTQ